MKAMKLFTILSLSAVMFAGTAVANPMMEKDTLKVIVDGELKAAVNLENLDELEELDINLDSIMMEVEKALEEIDENIQDIEIIEKEDEKVIIIKDKDGKYRIIDGSKVEESFFLQPYQELLQLRWSSGINKENRDLVITHIDARPKFMWYEFGVRTKDNVELILGVTFFWQIVDVDKMVRTTDDAPGDICSHARSMIIQSVSKSPLEKFLDSFNDVVRAAIINEDDPFYEQRGVKIHSVEVRSVTCPNPRPPA